MAYFKDFFCIFWNNSSSHLTRVTHFKVTTSHSFAYNTSPCMPNAHYSNSYCSSDQHIPLPHTTRKFLRNSNTSQFCRVAGRRFSISTRSPGGGKIWIPLAKMVNFSYLHGIALLYVSKDDNNRNTVRLSTSPFGCGLAFGLKNIFDLFVHDAFYGTG